MAEEDRRMGEPNTYQRKGEDIRKEKNHKKRNNTHNAGSDDGYESYDSDVNPPDGLTVAERNAWREEKAAKSAAYRAQYLERNESNMSKTQRKKAKEALRRRIEKQRQEEEEEADLRAQTAKIRFDEKLKARKEEEAYNATKKGKKDLENRLGKPSSRDNPVTRGESVAAGALVTKAYGEVLQQKDGMDVNGRRQKEIERRLAMEEPWSFWPAWTWRSFWRGFDFLGLLTPSKPLTRYDPTFREVWRHISRTHRICYLLYIGPLLFLILSLATILFLPWKIFGKEPPFEPHWNNVPTKEKKGKNRGRKKTTNRQDARDVCAPLGYGPCCRHEKKPTNWQSFWQRVYDMYSLLGDTIRMFTRQGLQITGVICGGTMAIMEIIRMAKDLNGGTWTKYMDAYVTGGDIELLKGEADCAYLLGTGFASWSGTYETFIWFILYHGWVLLLCLMLIADEVLNVRMGLLSPQWSRAGNGYTMIFLALCLVNGSPNWGWKIMIPVHHLILLIVMACGAYNVLRLILDALDCTPDQSIARENKRSCRLPLRPWTDDQWEGAWQTGNFRVNQNKLHYLRQAEEALNDHERKMSRNVHPSRYPPKFEGKLAALEEKVAEAQKDLDVLYPSELLQMLIGDHARELMDVAEVRRMKAEGEVYDEKAEGAPVPIKEEKAREVKVRERGRMGRGFIHGRTILPPRLTSEDNYLIAPNCLSEYFCSRYLLDRFYVYIGTEPLLVEIAGKKRWLYHPKGIAEERIHIYQPTTDEWHPDAPVRKGFRWETEMEYNARAARDLKCAADYQGNHNWQCPTPLENRRLYIWFDIRRGICGAAAFCMMLVHVALIFYNVGFGAKSFPQFTAQHKLAAEAWKANGGPSDTACQFYQGSALAIWIRPGGQTWRGVFLAMWFYVGWEIFIIGLCLGVLFVAATNNRTYGMHLVVPISLIGPRLSSVSMGWTLSFVGAATLQMGLFQFQPVMMWIARIVGYWCIAAWIICLAPNEEMRGFVSRKPYFFALSCWAHEWLNTKMVLKRKRDSEYE